MILRRIFLLNKIDTKLIVSDFDGTLKHSSNTVSKQNAEIINLFTKKNGKFVIATARPIFGLRPFVCNISHIHYYILCNGAQIIDSHQQELYAQYIHEESLKMLIQQFWNDPEIFFLFIGKEFTFTNHIMNEQPFSDYQKVLRSQLISQKTILKKKIHILNIEVHSSRSKLKKIEEYILTHNMTALVSQLSWRNFMEIHSSQISKGIALKFVQNKLNIEKSQTLAFGDGNNDIELFRQAGITVAMENATETLKKQAQFVTKNFDEDGVAVFIKKYIL